MASARPGNVSNSSRPSRNERVRPPSGDAMMQAHAHTEEGTSRSFANKTLRTVPITKKQSGRPSSANKKIRADGVWARAVSLNPAFPHIDISKDEITIGRSSKCDIIIELASVSSVHCRIKRDHHTNATSSKKKKVPTNAAHTNPQQEYNKHDNTSKPSAHQATSTNGKIWLQDESTNGTFCDNHLVGKGAKVPISSGTEITILGANIHSEKVSYILYVLEDEAKNDGPGDKGEPVVFVFTDIEKSTSLWEQSPEMMDKALRLHDSIFRDLLRLFRGYEVKTEGDAFMVAFFNVFDAIRWCLAAQIQLLHAEWEDKLIKCESAREQKLPRETVRKLQDAVAQNWEKLVKSKKSKRRSWFKARPGSRQGSVNAGDKARGANEGLIELARLGVLPEESEISKASELTQVQKEEAEAASAAASAGQETKDLVCVWRGLRVRMGIHIGVAKLRRNPITHRMDYYGPVVNRSARVADSGHGGQIVFTPEVYAIVRESMDLTSDKTDPLEGFDLREMQNLQIKDLGEHDYRGIPEPVRVYQVAAGILVARRFEPLRCKGEGVETEAKTGSAAGAELMTAGQSPLLLMKKKGRRLRTIFNKTHPPKRSSNLAANVSPHSSQGSTASGHTAMPTPKVGGENDATDTETNEPLTRVRAAGVRMGPPTVIEEEGPHGGDGAGFEMVGDEDERKRLAARPLPKFDESVELRKCARAGCGKKEKASCTLKNRFGACGSCKSVFYCSRKCQSTHWTEKHRYQCWERA